MKIKKCLSNTDIASDTSKNLGSLVCSASILGKVALLVYILAYSCFGRLAGVASFSCSEECRGAERGPEERRQFLGTAAV